jgi:hypothetical protein
MAEIETHACDSELGATSVNQQLPRGNFHILRFSNRSPIIIVKK